MEASGAAQTEPQGDNENTEPVLVTKSTAKVSKFTPTFREMAATVRQVCILLLV